MGTQILTKVSGCCRPGEVLAFMGPSGMPALCGPVGCPAPGAAVAAADKHLRHACAGSGKTTLLSIIGHRAQKSLKSNGTVSYNGGPLTKAYKRKLGFVMQACPAPLARQAVWLATCSRPSQQQLLAVWQGLLCLAPGEHAIHAGSYCSASQPCSAASVGEAGTCCWPPGRDCTRRRRARAGS